MKTRGLVFILINVFRVRQTGNFQSIAGYTFYTVN